MNKILTLSLVMAVLLIPILTFAGTCGVGDDCQYCATQELCEAEANCIWNVDTCEFDGLIPLASGTITGLLSFIGGFFTDLSLVVVLAIGLPLGFWVISRVIALVRARA